MFLQQMLKNRLKFGYNYHGKNVFILIDKEKIIVDFFR